MDPFKTILFTVTEGVGIITMNQPETLNVMSAEMEREVMVALTRCRHEEKIRAVLITGAGRAFSAGGDIRSMEKGLAPFEGKEWVELANQIVEAVTSLPKPVIAAVNGPAVGGGMNLALICDFVIASEKAFFSEIFSQVGLVPDTGGHWILPRLVGYRKAMELIFTAERIEAQKALTLGLINRVVPPENLKEEALGLAKKLASGPTLALGTAKAILKNSWNSDLSSVLELEAFGQGLLFGTEDHKEGIKAFREKRLPKFRGK